MLHLLGSGLAFLADFFVKEWIEKNIGDSEQRKICHGKIQIEKYHNKGAALNTLENRSKRVKVIHMAVLVWTAVYTKMRVKENPNIANKIGRGLLLAGGLNNLYDRCKRGYVVDYLRFQTPWKKLNRIVFNLSDFYVFFGAALFAISSRDKKLS